MFINVIPNLFRDLVIQKFEGRQLKPTEIKKSGRQTNLECKKIGRDEDRLFTLTSLSSNNPPTIQSVNRTTLPTSLPKGTRGHYIENQPSPQPSPIGEGVLRHSEPSAERIQPVQNNRNGGNASLILPNVLTGGEKPGNQVAYSNVIAHLLRNLEFVLKRPRNMCAMTGLNILSPVFLGEGVRRTALGFVGWQSNVQHEIDCHPELVSGSHKILNSVQDDRNIFLKRTFSHIHLFTYSLHKKAAFTLAEVLITLGIIGIVAAMTMPALIANHRIKVLHTQFLKAYSDLSNAAKLFETHEDMTVYDYSYTYDCGNSSCSGNIRPTKTFETFMNYFINSRYATKLTSSTRWEELGYEPKNLNSQSVTIHPCDESGTMFETTGRIIQFDNAVTSMDIKTGPKVCMDINGKKGPNKYGYDWFVFTFTSTGNVIPYTGSALRYNSDVELKDKTEYCNKKSSSAQYTCSYFALINQSPEDNSKKYWGDFIK